MPEEAVQKKPLSFQVLRILAVVSVLVMLVPFVLDLFRGTEKELAPAPGTYPVNIVDRAELLSDAEEKKLLQTMQAVAAYHPTAFVSVSSTGGKSTSRYAELLFDDIFPQKNGILFLIDMDNRKIWLQKANGNAKLTTALCNTVTDNVYRYATAANYYACANNAFKQVCKILEGEQVPQTMKHLSNLFLALVAAVLIVFHFAAKGTGVIKPKKVFDVDDNMTRQLSTGNVKKRFLRKIETRSYDSSSDSGGGFSGGGGGGFSSGGGGGGGGSSSSGGGHSF